MSAELREWRRKAGLTCKQVADALDVSVAKVSRMETGERGLFADDVSALLGLYRVPQQRRVELLDLVRNCHEPNWWQIASPTLPPILPSLWSEVMDVESRAASIVNFETMFVPGLVQTPEYAAEILRGAWSEPPAESVVQGLVAARMARTRLLGTRPAPKLSLIVDEAVLRRRVGEPSVMVGQLHHLLSCARRDNITLQVLPFEAGVTPGLEGPSVLYDLRDGSSVVYVEVRGANAFLGEEHAIRSTRIALRSIGKAALNPVESARFIAKIAEERAQVKE
ncbi:helix-turn-helix domain-containing protein [Actinokineospora soli]|uniref:Helix-turn-helix domain-containing protein n=1 Tax=Actinokineospora soli TaxID=1048753 RepID=A0ABW2TWW9_9PSEU